MPLIRNGRIAPDPFHHVADESPIADDDAVVVPAARLIADASEFAQRTGQTGVLWPNDRDISDLAPYLDRLALVELVFPNFKDGRAYSQARILRERYRFRGELRATGEVLRDQFVFLLRSGFDSFEVKKQADAEAFAETVRRYSVFYQPAGDGAVPALRRRLHSALPSSQVADAVMRS